MLFPLYVPSSTHGVIVCNTVAQSCRGERAYVGVSSTHNLSGIAAKLLAAVQTDDLQAREYSALNIAWKHACGEVRQSEGSGGA